MEQAELDKTIEEGFAALGANDAQRAHELGQLLLQSRHISGFEIVALALQQMGRADEAISLLSNGTGRFPQYWPLWELLGNIYTDTDKYREAQEAYQRALACQNVDASSVNLNLAALYQKAGQDQQALTFLGAVSNEDLRYEKNVLAVSSLVTLQRYEEAVNLANATIAELLKLEGLSDSDARILAQCFAEIGRAYLEGRADQETAWQFIWKAFEWQRCDSLALHLTRQILNAQSPQSHWFRLELAGRWYFPLEEGKRIPDFVCLYDVVANSAEEALQLAQMLEPQEVRSSMQIQKQEDRGLQSDLLQGVYWRSAYAFYA